LSTEITIEIRVDKRLFKIVIWILDRTKFLWYPWREKIFKWIETGRPIPLIRYKISKNDKWRWLKK